MQNHLQKLPPMATNLRRDDDDKQRKTMINDDKRRETKYFIKTYKYKINKNEVFYYNKNYDVFKNYYILFFIFYIE